MINYKPFNIFIKEDKFSLHKINVLVVHLGQAKIFSKFDLKAGFWQLGIQPENRYKTAFCIPNAQYQWIVMPFGLNVALLLFQKAMTKIFEPILQCALIYIDDILLFSKHEKEHKELLLQFVGLVAQYSITFSSKK